MKSYNNLFDKIVNEENIRKAVLIAARGKRDKACVRKALKNIDKVVGDISYQLKNDIWRPVEIHQTKLINDGVELKKRYIVCPNFIREQCVHHAIMNICEPIFIKRFYNYSCGSVKGRGAEQAKKYISKSIKKRKGDTKYVSKLDIKKFFHNVRPSFVFKAIRRIIRDRRVLRLFYFILRSNKQVINGSVVKSGIPIGFFTSPHFANVLLNYIDHYVKEVIGVKIYVRYMDDIIMFDGNKRRLRCACFYIKNEIIKLRMSLKPIWQIHKFSSVCFIGYQFKKNCTRLRDRIFLKAVRLFKRVKAKVRMTTHDCLRVLSYCGRFKNADTRHAFLKYISAYINIRETRKRVSKYYKAKGVKYAF